MADILRDVPRRPGRPLYEPRWADRHFAWASDVLAKLDPSPLGRRTARLLEPARDMLARSMETPAEWLVSIFGEGSALGRVGDSLGRGVGRIAVPVDRVLRGVAIAIHRPLSGLSGLAERVVIGLPFPKWFRRTLWLPPFDRGTDDTLTAQARVKARYASVVWVCVTLSAGIHFSAFLFSPTFSPTDLAFESMEVAIFELPPEVEIPPPPRAVVRPAVPVISDVLVDETATIAATTFEANPVSELPPPEPRTEVVGESVAVAEEASRPTFTPFTVAPEIRNAAELVRLIGEHYPPSLRDAGIGGVVVVWFFIDVEGRVTDTRVAQTSGFPQLDSAALQLSDRFVFSPALYNDQHVPVWVQFPITFAVR